ncbi:periplasmic-type flagellar collar protein FlbB [Spirochaeta dissipatitropha]
MAKRYSKTGPGVKILGLLFLIVVFLIGGSLWFDYLGIIDAGSFYAPVFRLFGLAARGDAIPADDPGLLDNLRLGKEREALDLREQELIQRRQDLSEEQERLQQIEAELSEREAMLEEREKTFNQTLSRYDNRRENLIQNAMDLNNMRPENAVGILRSYDDQLLIDTLRIAEELAREQGEMSLVSVWLSQLPPERAADIQRKMAMRPGG